jgi:DNA-binding transcriptional LysR family regulator
MDFNKLKFFCAVAKLGSITTSASELKISPSAISLAITVLEKEIGCQLFKRKYRGMELTQEGDYLYQSSISIFQQVENVVEKINQNKNKIKGVLTIATSFGLASSNWFTTKLNYISKKLPNLKLKIIDFNLNVIDGSSFDIIICPHIYNRLDLIHEEVKEISFKLFASESYLQEYGIPKKESDLDSHKLISFSKEDKNPFNDVDSLLHIGRKPIDPRETFMEVSTSTGMLKLLNLGSGIGSLSIEAGEENNLIEIFPNQKPFVVPVSIVFHKKNEDVLKIKTFKNLFLKGHL